MTLPTLRSLFAVAGAVLALTSAAPRPAHAQATTDSAGMANTGTATQGEMDHEEDDTDMGWVGLLGLAGLAGLRRRPAPVVHTETVRPGGDPTMRR